MNTQQLESELWEAADQLRANSKLTAAEYAMPVLGLIFLRQADNRFATFLPEIEAGIPTIVPADVREQMIKQAFKGKAAVYLPHTARYTYLAQLPRSENLGKAIEDAMEAIEVDQPILQGALPRGYSTFEPDLLADLVKIFDRPAIRQANGDVFGRIYEYFLNKFAMTGAQEGGEFFTPPSLVRMIVNIIEPDRGKVLDPACGSAGMFVQTSHFIDEVQHQIANDRVTFYGQEKSDTNTRLARMNLVVHGLDATNIRQGNTFYDRLESLIGGCDFVMANPPFNVDGVVTEKVEADADAKGRLPFGLPGTNAKTGAISNANSLWIQYFYAYLNQTGRAGFVMASSTSDAGNKDRDIREQLVKTGHVDAMVAIGNKFFYTRSLPCTLWFFDKGKPKERNNTVLMLDARSVYHVVSARSHVFTDEQLANLNAIVWLYRGETQRFVELVERYQRRVDALLAAVPECLAANSAAVDTLATLLQTFAKGALVAELNSDSVEELHVTQAQLEAYAAELTTLRSDDAAENAVKTLLVASAQVRKAVASADLSTHGGQVALQASLDALIPQLNATRKLLEARQSSWLRLADAATKVMHAGKSNAFDGKSVRAAKRELMAADPKKNEQPTVRDAAHNALEQTTYFIRQIQWLHSRFPNGIFEHVPGLCKAVTTEEIAANDYSLTPGRYVGVAPAGADDDDDFVEKLREIHGELAELNDKAAELAARIACNLEELLG